MNNLQHRQSIIQEKRKKTPWRDFVMEICSWQPLMFYKNKGHISTYPESNRVNICSMENYSHNEPIEISQIPESLFDGLRELFSLNSLSCVNHWGENENAHYVDTAVNIKNSYLSFVVTKGAQDVLYSFMCRESANVVESVFAVDNSQNVFHSKAVISSANIFYSKYIKDSRDVRFSINLLGCQECVMCNQLEHRSYCIDNIQYSKEEYNLKKAEILKNKNLFESYYGSLDQEGSNFASTNSHGSFIIASTDIDQGYIVFNGKKGHNNTFVGSIDEGERWFDFCVGGAGSKDMYAVANSGNFSEYIYCSWGMGRCYSCFYSYSLEFCSFCLGCVGLKNKSYCILNKQYTKEERYIEVDNIFGRLSELPLGKGGLGGFFPPTMNPFYFNDTVAYLIDPTFTKEEVTAKGYLRRDEPIKVDIPAGVQTVKVSELSQFEGWSVGTQFFASDHIFASVHNNTSYQFADGKNSIPTDAKWTINDEILKKVIIDEEGNAYRIIPMELEFLRKYELPLPRKHWLDRMKENFRIN